MFSRSQRGHLSRGQSLVEFAIVAPIVIAVIGAIIQFGIVFWAQNTLTQVVRDTGRWAATQSDCLATVPIVDQANAIAANSSLFGYGASTFRSGVTVAFSKDTHTLTDGTTATCPPKTNESVDYVSVTITHQVPTFFPGMQYLPALGTCDPNCHITLSSTAQFRLEPKP
jgi:Flp pilus assembly protein TadG